MSRAKLQYVGKIIDRLKEHLDAETDFELADRLGLSRNAISVWRHRENIDLPLVITKCKDLNIHWLITGEAPPESQGETEITEAEASALRQLREYGWDTLEFLTLTVEMVAVMKKFGRDPQIKDIAPVIMGMPIDDSAEKSEL